ncbi:MAG: cold shock domain-containing protein [Flavobacteriales bacterium]|nr:cold shock domain-containing protein [Flavobacteriales bacterium]
MRGTVTSFNAVERFGFIKPDDGIQPLYFNASDLIDPTIEIKQGDYIDFVVEPSSNFKKHKYDRARGIGLASKTKALALETYASNDCFVVMPHGRTPEEVRWFRGWYEVAIKPAVIAAGYDPVLSSVQDQPNAINDEIRAHLALDPMVVVDLGGYKPESDPNPNVMYELGIRHAFNLPHVIMAWKGQRLPFDIANQRVIMENREMLV